MGALTGPGRSLAGTAAVVTGGAGLIGASIANLLARQGAQIVIVDTDHTRAQQVAAGIVGDGGDVVSLEADIGDEADVTDAFAAIDELGAPLQVLVNCAAPIALALQETPAAEITYRPGTKGFA